MSTVARKVARLIPSRVSCCPTSRLALEYPVDLNPFPRLLSLAPTDGVSMLRYCESVMVHVPVLRRARHQNSTFRIICIAKQERFRMHIHSYPSVIAIADKMVRRASRCLLSRRQLTTCRDLLCKIRAAAILNVPVIATEQSPRGELNPRSPVADGDPQSTATEPD